MAWVRGDGLIVDEPAVVAWAAQSERAVAFGQPARRQIEEGREGVAELGPLGLGELANPEAAAQLVRQLTSRVVGRITFARHELVLAVPAALSTASRRVLLEAALGTGARMAHLLDLPLALGFGAGLPVTSWDPSPVLFLLPQGAQAAVVCHHGLLSEETLEWKLGAGPPGEEEAGLVQELLARVFDGAPQSARARLQAAGLAMAGRGVALEAWRDALVRRTGIRSRVVADPEQCVVKGAEVALERIEGVGARALLYLR